MPDGRRMGKTELFAHFSEKFGMKRTEVRDLFDALQALSEAELQRAGEFVLPGMVKFVVQNRPARMGRNPSTGAQILIAAKTVVKARIAKPLKDSVLTRTASSPVSPWVSASSSPTTFSCSGQRQWPRAPSFLRIWPCGYRTSFWGHRG